MNAERFGPHAEVGVPHQHRAGRRGGRGSAGGGAPVGSDRGRRASMSSSASRWSRRPAHHGERGAAPAPGQRHAGKPAPRWACGRSRTSASSFPASRSATAWSRCPTCCILRGGGPPHLGRPGRRERGGLRHRSRRTPLHAAGRRRSRAGPGHRAGGARRRLRPGPADRPLRARTAGAGDLVPAPQHRRAERRHAPPPAGGDRARARGGEGHLRQRASPRRCAAGTPRGGDRGTARAAAHPAGDHGAPHRGQAGHGAGEAPPDLPQAGGSRIAPVDAARAAGADRPAAERDRPALDDGRAAAGEADGAAGGVLGPALLPGDAVRRGAGDAGPAGAARWRSSIPASRSTCSPFFQFGSWVGGDRDGNPFVTNRGDPATR